MLRAVKDLHDEFSTPTLLHGPSIDSFAELQPITSAMSHPSVYPTNSAEFFTRILSKMEGRANELSIKGVAVVAFYHPGKEFLSQMRVVGCMRNDEANYLAIAYSKIAEMCDTLQASGGRKALLGEFGYIGGAIQKGEGFYYLAAFSGASGLEDLEVSRCGLSSL